MARGLTGTLGITLNKRKNLPYSTVGRDDYQAQILPTLTETVLDVETSLDVSLRLYFPAHQISRLLRPDPVQPGPARPLTADWTAWTDWSYSGAGAPPPPPAARCCRDVLG